MQPLQNPQHTMCKAACQRGQKKGKGCASKSSGKLVITSGFLSGHYLKATTDLVAGRMTCEEAKLIVDRPNGNLNGLGIDTKISLRLNQDDSVRAVGSGTAVAATAIGEPVRRGCGLNSGPRMVAGIRRSRILSCYTAKLIIHATRVPGGLVEVGRRNFARAVLRQPGNRFASSGRSGLARRGMVLTDSHCRRLDLNPPPTGPPQRTATRAILSPPAPTLAPLPLSRIRLDCHRLGCSSSRDEVDVDAVIEAFFEMKRSAPASAP